VPASASSVPIIVSVVLLSSCEEYATDIRGTAEQRGSAEEELSKEHGVVAGAMP